VTVIVGWVIGEIVRRLFLWLWWKWRPRTA